MLKYNSISKIAEINRNIKKKSPAPRAEVEKGCKPVRVGLRAWATIGFGAVDARPAEIILAAYCASGSLFFSEMYPRFFAERNMNLDLLLPPIGKNIR
jgi:hypothetical protein